MSSTPLRLTAHSILSSAVVRRSSHRLLLFNSSNPTTLLSKWSVNSRVSLLNSRASNSPPFPNDDREVARVGDLDTSSTDQNGGENGELTVKKFSSKELLQGLKRYGIAGVLSYGLLNTVYYLTTFLFVWFHFAPASRKIGYAAAIERFLKVMAMVWAGSQVTKLIRAGGALALAPFVDRGLSWFMIKFKFKSKGKAFVAIAGMCFGLVFLFFGLTVLLA